MTNALVTGAKYALKEKIEDIQYWRRRRRHKATSASALAFDRNVVDELRSAGGYVSSLDALAIPGTADMLKAADALFSAIADRPPGKGGFIASATQDEVERYP